MHILAASMKVPPKRKGNIDQVEGIEMPLRGLNESPSEKEGKFQCSLRSLAHLLVPQ